MLYVGKLNSNKKLKTHLKKLKKKKICLKEFDLFIVEKIKL